MGPPPQANYIEKGTHIIIGHAIQNMGYVLLRMVAVYEEEINEVQEFSAGFVSFAILLLIIACLPV